MSDAIQLQTQVPEMEEESSWEVFTDESSEEFCSESEESDYEDNGDEVLRYRARKRSAVS